MGSETQAIQQDFELFTASRRLISQVAADASLEVPPQLVALSLR